MIRLQKHEVYSPNRNGYFIEDAAIERITEELRKHYGNQCDTKYTNECIEMITETIFDLTRNKAVDMLTPPSKA